MADTPDMAPVRTRRTGSQNGSRTSRAKSEAEDAELAEQVARLQEDLKAIAASVAHLAESTVGEAKHVAQRQAKSLARTGQHAVEEIQDEFTHLQKQIKDTIRQKPLTAVAGAVALGFLIALITQR